MLQNIIVLQNLSLISGFNFSTNFLKRDQTFLRLFKDKGIIIAFAT